MAKKQQYGQELRNQMQENERKRKEALAKKKMEDLEEELRLKRERELIEQRMKEENQRYRPKINLPIQKSIEIKEPKKEEENARYFVITDNKDNLSESLRNYLRTRENQIDDFNDKMMKSLQLLNKEYQYNIGSLRGQINILNGIHLDNKQNKDKFVKDVYDIKDDLYYRKVQNKIDANHLYDIVAKSNYANQTLRKSVGSVPRRKFDIKSYTTNKIYYADDRLGDGLTIPPYINFSHYVYNNGPRWRNNESVWWYY